MTDYLAVIEVLKIHQIQIQRYGGSEGVRDYYETAHFIGCAEERSASYRVGFWGA